jgi:DNA polymerase-1
LYPDVPDLRRIASYCPIPFTQCSNIAPHNLLPMHNPKKLFLLDAYALIFRAYYAFISNPMKNSKGLNTSTTFGFTLALDDVLKNQNPSHIAVAFDTSAPTFRHYLFPEYKGTREETPEDIKLAVPYIKKVIEAYKIPILEVEGYEADDVIGTLAKQAEKEGFEVFMMTPDKDFAQLVSENIKMYKPKRSGADAEIWGPVEVMKYFEITDPTQVIDILALWGDASDNIPGVPGIGEKTAKKIIAEYGNLENVYNNLPNFKGKQKENLELFKDKAFLSRDLATIRLDVPVKFDENKFIVEEIDNKKLKVLFEELEFKTLLSRIVKPQEIKIQISTQQGDLFGGFQSKEASGVHLDNIATIKKDYRLVTEKDEIDKLVLLLKESGSFAFDTETTDLEIYKADLVGISFSIKRDHGFYLPVPQDFNSAHKLLSSLKQVFENKQISKIGQNIKFDIRMLKKYNIEVTGDLFDTMIAHYLLQPEQRHNLNYLSETYLGYTPVKIEELIGQKGANQGNMKNVPLEKIKDYAAEDADLAWQLGIIFKDELKKADLENLANIVEMPLIYVLACMEHEGVKMDKGSLDEFRKDLVNDIIAVEAKIYKLAGVEFNISSPKQLGEILFERLKIDTDAKKTKSLQFTTSEEVLSKLEGKHEIVSEVLTYRGLKKLLSTYVDALPKLAHPVTDKIHTSFNQTIAATGRLSSNNPNLQNIPIREERGREIRKAFIPELAGQLFLSADYSQIELRIMAHLSEDKNMIEAFLNEEDIHTATAAKIYKLDPGEVTREMRNHAKTANFGIIYGISSFGLSQRLNISRQESKELIDNYFINFPGVRAYMDNSIKIARDKGFVQTMMGRKRYLPDIHSRNAIVRGAAERNAINAPIQGSAADIIKLAMINIHKSIKEHNMTAKMILQVHDELVFQVSMNELEQLKKIVRQEMESAVILKVPLTVEMGTGKNWFEAEH